MSAVRNVSWSRRARLVMTVAALFGTVSYRVHAASPAAEALFEEGRRLLEAGRTDEACLKLAESLAQEMSSGTLLNLALCHETQGLVATAWAEYRAAARLARNQGRSDRAETADERARLLEPKLPRLTLTAERAVPGLNATIDDDVIGEGALGLAVPIDPGEHRVTVSAPGHASWTTTVSIGAAEQRSLHIPALEAQPPSAAPLPLPAAAGAALAAPAPKAPASAQTREDEAGSSAPVAGLIVGGVGVVALGVGVGFGLSSLASYNEADKLCPSPHLDCSNAAISERTSAESAAWVSTIAFGVGLVGVGVGAYLVLTTGSDTHDEKQVTLRAKPIANGGWLGAFDRVLTLVTADAASRSLRCFAPRALAQNTEVTHAEVIRLSCLIVRIDVEIDDGDRFGRKWSRVDDPGALLELREHHRLIERG